MFPNWAKNILFLLVLMLSGLTLVVIIEGLTSGTELMPFNMAVEQAMIGLRTPLLTNFFVLVTNVGSPFVMALVSIAIAVWLALRRDFYDAALFIVVILVSLVSFLVLKNSFQLSRPTSELFNFGGWSFPSGHSTVITSLTFMVAYTFFGRVKSMLGKFNLVVGSILVAVLVCISRLYLGAHWALDVLAGISLGLLSVSFTILIFSLFFERWRSSRKKIGL